MVFRIVQSGNSLPFSYPVDPSAEFEGGMIAQLSLYGNNIVCGVSDGTCPLGIIDDIKTTSFHAPSIDETIIVAAVGRQQSGRILSVTDVMATLENSNITRDSFVCDVPVHLRERNGVIVFPAGTALNYDLDGDGIFDSIKAVCSYVYLVPGIPGDDSTIGSGRVTVWFQRGIYVTDMYEVSQRYPINSNLFCNESGLLTTRQVTPSHPTIGITTGPPTSRNSFLEFMLL